MECGSDFLKTISIERTSNGCRIKLAETSCLADTAQIKKIAAEFIFYFLNIQIISYISELIKS
ncbi:hypothetical protein X975_13597, partial [Stegodyphus mimosarum]